MSETVLLLVMCLAIGAHCLLLLWLLPKKVSDTVDNSV